MSSEYTCNVEKLAEERKEEVRQFFYTQILSQYKDTKEIIDWCLSSLFDKYPVLGTAHWNIWEEQTGKWLERAVLFNFGIERNTEGVILNDDELKLLANISAISNVGKENFYDLSQAISTRKTPITGFISTDNLFLYVLNDATDTLLKAMLYYKKLYIPLEDTYLINLPKNALRYDKIPTLPLYFGTQGEYSPTAPQYAVVLAYDGWSYSCHLEP